TRGVSTVEQQRGNFLCADVPRHVCCSDRRIEGRRAAHARMVTSGSAVGFPYDVAVRGAFRLSNHSSRQPFIVHIENRRPRRLREFDRRGHFSCRAPKARVAGSFPSFSRRGKRANGNGWVYARRNPPLEEQMKLRVNLTIVLFAAVCLMTALSTSL